MPIQNRLTTAIVIAISSVWALSANAEPSLEQEILAEDTKLFNAFNNCDVNTMANILSKDLEFYHDLGGVGDHQGTMRTTKENCGRNLGLVRTLIPESTRVYPVKDFGAIQQGEHTFCHMDNGKNDCGTFGFTHLWKQTDAGWEVYMVLSYGH